MHVVESFKRQRQFQFIVYYLSKIFKNLIAKWRLFLIEKWFLPDASGFVNECYAFDFLLFFWWISFSFCIIIYVVEHTRNENFKKKKVSIFCSQCAIAKYMKKRAKIERLRRRKKKWTHLCCCYLQSFLCYLFYAQNTHRNK